MIVAKIIKIPSVYVYDTKVVGVSMKNEDGSFRQEFIQKEVKENDQLDLVPEPLNSYDENAIKVVTQNGNQIGYLPKEVASQILPAIRNEAEIHVTVKWVNGEQMKGVGLRIELVS